MTAELVVALDVPDAAAALRLADALRGEVRWLKVGSGLFVAEGPALVRELVSSGFRVFLDLKWHDIPSTVASAVASAAGLGVALATVHLAGGAAMLRAAAAEAARAAPTGERMQLVGVGVLTSLDAPAFGRIVGRPVTDVGVELLRLAGDGMEAGLDGAVCSAHEAARLRSVLGAGALLVVPGIRPAGGAAGDQARTATPEAAVAAGADLLVVGRPITGASDPASAARAIRRAMGP